MTRVLVGLFDNRGDAERTVEHLVQGLGIDPADVEVHGAGGRAETRQGAVGQPNLFRRLAASFMSREDYEVLRQGIRRQGVVVVARVAEALTDRAMDVFEEYGAADLDARRADWRGADWTQGTGGTGHDEDIGFVTYGEDAVFGHIPKHHHDNTPAGLLGRLQMAVMQEDAAATRAKVRSYKQEPKAPGQPRR
jgi:hypothetical protein